MVTDERLKKLGYKLLRSKYQGSCSDCKKQYFKDSMIWWSKEYFDGEPFTHVICSQCVPPTEEDIISVMKKEQEKKKPVVKKKRTFHQSTLET